MTRLRMNTPVVQVIQLVLSKITGFKADVHNMQTYNTGRFKYSTQIGQLCTATLKGIESAYQNSVQLEPLLNHSLEEH